MSSAGASRGPVALALLALIFAVSLGSRLAWLEAVFPYPRHVDEAFLAGPALRVLQRGDPDPDFFRYPSLPIYLASAGMSLGAALSMAKGELESRAAIGSVGLPWYAPASVMRVPRAVQALLASAALVLVAAIGVRLRPAPSMLVLGPAVLALNPYYHEEGWLYLNVDIVAAFFALAATWQILRGSQRPGFRSLVLGPAVLCAATAASKYPSGLVLAPALLAVLWYAPPERRLPWTASLLGITALAFVAFCPYSVLRFDAFVADVLFEVQHYADGRGGLHEADPGLDQVAGHAQHLLRTTGPVLPGFAGLGALVAWRADRRRATLLLLFPLLLLLLVSVQRVQFHRNLVPAYGILAVAAGLGLHAFHGWLAGRLRFLRDRHARIAVAGVLLVAVAASLPATAVLGLIPQADSRNRAAAWLGEHAAAGSTVWVPPFLAFDPASLPDGFHVLDPAGPRAPSAPPAGDCYLLAPHPAAGPNDPAGQSRAAQRRAWLADRGGTPALAEFGRAPLGRSGPWTGQLRIRIVACARAAREGGAG